MRLKAKQFFGVILGTLFMALSLDIFLVPADIAPGGISGFAIIINHLTNAPLGLLILGLNIPIFLWGIRHFTKKFMLFSLFGMGLLSLLTDLLAFLPPITLDKTLCSIFGGALLGLGVGTVFSSNCTTGGTDIAAQILKRKHPHISLGKFVLAIDLFVVALAGVVFGKWEVSLYSAIALFISAYIIDLIIEGGDFAKIAYVITEFPERLSGEISEKLERGTTLLHGSSFYTNSKRPVLMCVMKSHEITKLKILIKEIDQNAFVIVSDAREVLGKGFKNH